MLGLNHGIKIKLQIYVFTWKHCMSLCWFCHLKHPFMSRYKHFCCCFLKFILLSYHYHSFYHLILYLKLFNVDNVRYYITYNKALPWYRLLTWMVNFEEEKEERIQLKIFWLGCKGQKRLCISNWTKSIKKGTFSLKSNEQKLSINTGF